MNKNTIFILSLLSLLSSTNAGVIKTVCFDGEGNKIPCNQSILDSWFNDNSSWWNWNNNNNNNADKKNIKTIKGQNSDLNLADNNSTIKNNEIMNLWNSWMNNFLKNWLNSVKNDSKNIISWNTTNDDSIKQTKGKVTSTTTTKINDSKKTSTKLIISTSSKKSISKTRSSQAVTKTKSKTKTTTTTSKLIRIPSSQTRLILPTTTTKLSSTGSSIPTSNAAQNSGSVNGFSLNNLPIQQFTMTDYEGCNQEQTQKLKALIEDIKIYRAAGKYVIDNQKEDELYQKIFLKYFKDISVISKVKEVFDNVNNMPTAKAYCETSANSVCTENTLAWTYLYSKEVHVCPIFFTRAMHGTIDKHTSEAASVILHELTHCHGTRDYAYGERDINYLNSSQASGNADTYRLYAMRAIYYLNDKVKGIHKREEDDEYLDQTIDFRVVPFGDKVIIRTADENEKNSSNLGKRNDDEEKEKEEYDFDFLNEDIDFRSEPFTDAVLIRPTSDEE